MFQLIVILNWEYCTHADVLVSSQRPVARFADLTSDEVADLFQCAHCIAPVLEKVRQLI